MTKTELRQAVRALSAGLYVDDTIQETCPACLGGTSGDLSLSLTRVNEGVLYNCYRALCNFRGFEGATYAISNKPNKKQFKPKKFTAATGLLKSQHYSFMEEKYELSTYDLDKNGFKRIPERDSYMMPTMNERGYVTGCIDRAFWGRKPKTILYKFMDFPSLSFAYRPESIQGKPVLLVEDVLSSIKASKFMPTAALLGTNISEKEINYLKKITDTIWIALDNDATEKSIAYKRKYNLYFKELKIIPLFKDIKDMQLNEIQEILTV